jgi:hypothetical protein
MENQRTSKNDGTTASLALANFAMPRRNKNLVVFRRFLKRVWSQRL